MTGTLCPSYKSFLPLDTRSFLLKGSMMVQLTLELNGTEYDRSTRKRQRLTELIFPSPLLSVRLLTETSSRVGLLLKRNKF